MREEWYSYLDETTKEWRPKHVRLHFRGFVKRTIYYCQFCLAEKYIDKNDFAVYDKATEVTCEE